MKKRVNHCLVQHGIYLSSLVSFPAPSFLPSPLLIFLQTKHAIRFFQSKQVDGFINKSQANQKTKKKRISNTNKSRFIRIGDGSRKKNTPITHKVHDKTVQYFLKATISEVYHTTSSST